jgi:hypothetical protein
VDRGAVVALGEEGMMDELEAVEIAKSRLSVHDELFPHNYGTVTLEVEVLRALLARAMRAHD